MIKVKYTFILFLENIQLEIQYVDIFLPETGNIYYFKISLSYVCSLHCNFICNVLSIRNPLLLESCAFESSGEVFFRFTMLAISTNKFRHVNNFCFFCVYNLVDLQKLVIYAESK